jgi:hypothetical protein
VTEPFTFGPVTEQTIQGFREGRFVAVNQKAGLAIDHGFANAPFTTAITGVPQAMASIGARPNGSKYDV